MVTLKWMGCLAIICAAVAPADVRAKAGAPSSPSEQIEIAPHVREASLVFGLPEHWIYAVIRQESAGRIRAVSTAGAMGLMQLMPSTWRRQRARFALGADPFEPRDNIIAGASYLREMYDLFGPDGFLAAYNAGPGRYRQWRDTGRPLPAETRSYIAALAAAMNLSGHRPIAPAEQAVVTHWTSSALFADHFPAISHPEQSPARLSPAGAARAAAWQADTLFVPVRGRTRR